MAGILLAALAAGRKAVEPNNSQDASFSGKTAGPTSSALPPKGGSVGPIESLK